MPSLLLELSKLLNQNLISSRREEDVMFRDYVQTVSWTLITAGFSFGITERFFHTDLFSVGIAGCFAALHFLLYPRLGR